MGTRLHAHVDLLQARSNLADERREIVEGTLQSMRHRGFSTIKDTLSTIQHTRSRQHDSTPET